MGYHSFLQGIFPTQGSNPGLLHWQEDSLPLSHQGSPFTGHYVCEVAQSCPTLRHPGLEPTRLPCPWNSTGKNTGVGSHALLQGIFPTQGSNLGLSALQADFLLSQLPGKPPRYYKGRRTGGSGWYCSYRGQGSITEVWLREEQKELRE